MIATCPLTDPRKNLNSYASSFRIAVVAGSRRGTAAVSFAMEDAGKRAELTQELRRARGWILGVGIMGSIGQNLITVAFRSAPAAVVAPFEYTAMLWGVLLDIAIWSVYPSALTLVGASIVIGAGLYLIQRERRQAAVAASG